ncbi:beta-ketoacyl synthase N-terminal-like domain-containing protein [Nonomuraea sp. NPDC050153]|uniref:type I polyketide synthase n=1 Tax=Nonomuraea sp. NPDC050153 TaxID=3364359 RepID=UPI0037ABC1E4
MSEALDEEATHIAVIGMACRFPGAGDPEKFWANLVAGVDSITRFPPQRSSGGQGPVYVPAGGFVADPDCFDAGYFGYSPREAQIIDPQHRVFMECTVEALEAAGCDPERHPGTIGVYAGAGETAYFDTLRAHQSALPSVTDWELRIATGGDFLTSRVAYKLGLRGPTITVRAACATSLVAVHLAAQGLLAGDCDLALAGGVAIRFPTETTHYTEGGIASPDGMCRSFDSGAQGLVGGEGACVVVLQRLPEALAAGYPIHAVMRGSAVNNDGADRIGFTAPSIEGQSAVIKAAQLVAGVEPRTITYVEAHGSATPMGDPIEIAALTRAFQAGSQQRGYCAVGSVKTNIGHTDTAAGGAGFIKTVLALKHGYIPPSLHFAEPNPEIDFETSPFRVVTQLRPWHPEGFPRRAGVSSFGMGGVNAHVVLEQPPPPTPSDPSGPWQLLVLSAKTLTALETMTDRLATHLRTHPELSLPDIAWTLQVGRREHPHRRYAVVNSYEDALRVLEGPERHRLVTSTGARHDRTDHPDRQAELASVGERWLAGTPISWDDIRCGERRLRVPLPTYPFERQRHIVEPEVHAVLARAPEEPASNANVQQTVAGLFAEILGLDALDPNDSFFDLGGDSLIATQLLIRIRKIFPSELNLRSIIEAPTANAFAAVIEEGMSR